MNVFILQTGGVGWGWGTQKEQGSATEHSALLPHNTRALANHIVRYMPLLYILYYKLHYLLFELYSTRKTGLSVFLLSAVFFYKTVFMGGEAFIFKHAWVNKHTFHRKGVLTNTVEKICFS